jgi:1-acyl-sn-glycerol-3-phosphate acyltransferase
VLVRSFAIAWYAGAFVIIVLAVPVVALVWAATFAFDRDRIAAGWLLRRFGSALARIFPFWHVRVEGTLPDGPFVLAPNHRSWLDIFVLSRLPREMKWVTKAEIFDVPWSGWLFRMSADIPVRRGDSDSGSDALAKARTYLEHGVPVVFFPEGTRSRDGKLRPFKNGAFDTAARTGVPVVPVAITGTDEGMPAGTLWIRRAHIVVRILPPIRGDDAASLREDTRAQILGALPPS